MMAIELTPEARLRFDEYLQRMRRTLRGSRSVEPTEVEANVREHVEVALSGTPGPVGAERLSAVLEQLGPPERWVPDEERPAWRRALENLMHGPEDWRLPYLALGAFALSLLLMPVGVGILFLLLSFFLSRAAVELVAELELPLGSRRWLILPPIVLVVVLIGMAVVIAPIAGGVAVILEDELGKPLAPGEEFEHIRYIAGVITLIAGAWWILLSSLFALAVNGFRKTFLPVTANLKRKHALAFLLAGVVVGSIGATLLFAVR